LEYLNVNPSEEQRTALRAMGQPAVTSLIAKLNHHDSKIKGLFVTYARAHPVIYNYFIASGRVIPEDQYQAEAAIALGEIGPAARAAIPALTEVYANGDFNTGNSARAALIKIRQESMAPLLAGLANTASTNWDGAAWTAKHLGTNGEAAVPLLVASLQNTNFGVRSISLYALGGIASRPDISIPALIACLKDNDPNIRRAATDGLCNFKESKAQVVPLLLSSMKDPNGNVWLGAAFGLEKLLDKNEKQTLYVPALVNSLNHTNEMIRENAKLFLKRNDPAAAAKAGVK
jgi:HEAT repeat protein